MTFQRVKSSDWTVNSLLTSTQISNMDKQLVKAIDKTGETLSGGGGVSGTIEWLSGSALTLRSGSTTTFQSGSSLVIATGSTLQSTLTVSGAGSFVMQSGATCNLQSGAAINAVSGSTVNISGVLTLGFTNVAAAGSTYAVLSTDQVVFVDTSTTAKTITLPAPVSGKVVTIKDSAQNASVKNISVVPHAAETIDGGSTSFIVSNSGCFCYMSDGTNWHTIYKI